jgi:transcriptional regulator GlxA family with amidase domain
MPGRTKDPVSPLQKRRFVFLTLPNYTMIALSRAIDPLRMANRLTKRDAYEWTLAPLDGKPAAASNGLAMSPTVALDEIAALLGVSRRQIKRLYVHLPAWVSEVPRTQRLIRACAR